MEVMPTMMERIAQLFHATGQEDVTKIQFINNYMQAHQTRFAKGIKDTIIAERYYRNENDIKTFDRFKDVNRLRTGASKNPLRNADNRISHNWHGLLLNQKASYIGNVPPKFDAGDSAKNKFIKNTLGTKYKKVFTDLVVNAGNGGVGWLHYWKEDGVLKYMSINPKECFPVFSNKGDGDLDGFIRRYPVTTPQGNEGVCYEYWDDHEVRMYLEKDKQLTPFYQFTVVDTHNPKLQESVNFHVHDFQGKIPFIGFSNNKERINDLKNIKGLIDVYDKVYSGYVNDLDDIQQMIFILTNYGGQNKEEFIKDLMYYKVVKIDQDEDSDPSGLETMSIDIPVEARNELLKITQEQIFIHGQGVNPNRENMNGNSGIALKYLYSLLDLKCNMLEAEFMNALDEFIRVMLEDKYPGLNLDELVIEQTWIRSAISDELEQAEVISRVAVVSSDEAIAKNNPLVGEDWEHEISLRKQQKMDELNMADMYSNPQAEKGGGLPNTYRQQVGVNNQLRGRDKQAVNQKAGVDPEGDG
jgi:SPP1 family phage portal protein